MTSKLQIFNTKSGKKEVFSPLINNKVTMYVCGPTVYDYSHIGHARVYVFFDVVYRYLKQIGFDTTYARNLTDIDDKIIRRANEEQTSFSKISKKYTKVFQDDMRALGCLDPDVEPKATEHISGMIKMIEGLIAKGHAYAIDGDVYFSVASFADYCSLSKRDQENLLVGARVEVDERKKQPLDFALWKQAKKDEPSWKSPWGQGRPGWHIECSVMSQKHLGTTIDIHGGGRDLIFPHHENEQAQSEAASQKPFVRYWMHNGFVNLDKEKMSKSLGNLITVQQLLQSHHPEVIRHLLLSSHYRSPIDFSPRLLDESRAAMERVYLFLEKSMADQRATIDETVLRYFHDAMNDDFNTPRVLALIFDQVKEGNRRLKESTDSYSQRAAIVAMGNCIGLFQQKPASLLRWQGKEEPVDENWVLDMIEKRRQARNNKNFAEADRIRNELLARNVLLEDSSQGTSWRFKD